MDARLIKIKRMIAAGRYDFILKANRECAADGLREEKTKSSPSSAFSSSVGDYTNHDGGKLHFRPKQHNRNPNGFDGP